MAPGELSRPAGARGRWPRWGLAALAVAWLLSLTAVCTGDGSGGQLRLAGGEHNCSGRVEVRPGARGAWGSVCARAWGPAEARVACRQLGCAHGNGTTAWSNSSGALGHVWLDGVACAGNESALWGCAHGGWGAHNCSGGADAWATCGGTPGLTLRLVDGGARCTGRVEILYQGRWGSVCDDGFGARAAAVVCAQLGCGAAISFSGSAHLGKGAGDIWLDDVTCHGNETALWDCRHRGWGAHNCGHQEDVGVICTEGADLELRLAGGPGRCAGRVDVRFQGQWGTVHDRGWDARDAEVVCRQLGCPLAVAAPGRGNASEGEGRVLLDKVACEGHEPELWRCTHQEWGRFYGQHREDAGVLCSDGKDLHLKLVGEQGRCSGIVEVDIQTHAGKVCHQGWTQKDADVVCRQLGCGSAVHSSPVKIPAKKAPGVWLFPGGCRGNESTFWNCKGWQWGGHPCDNLEAVHIVCSAYREPRLAGGRIPCSGRVELSHDDEWGTVCDSDLSLESAEVLCRALGCGSLVSIVGGAHFGEGSGQSWAEEFQCQGDEAHISLCPVAPHPEDTCGHNRDVGIICSRYTEIRLVDGPSPCEGRVELRVHGNWGPLCSTHWDIEDAHVLCRQLQCGVALSTPTGTHFGTGGGHTWGHRFHCRGTESHIGDCAVTALGSPLCPEGNLASVICSGNVSQTLQLCNASPVEPTATTAPGDSASQAVCLANEQIRLVGGGGRCAGRVEVFHDGTWGTVCDDGWDLKDAHVVCMQLGCGLAVNATTNAYFGEGTGPIWLDEISCSGTEHNLLECRSHGWGRQNCRHKEDAGVVCMEFLALRLGGGGARRACEGRVEVKYRGEWGGVGRAGLGPATLGVVCRQLGCADSGRLVDAPADAAGGLLWVEHVQCPEGPDSLWHCPSAPWKQRLGSPAEEAWVRCDDKVRLRGGRDNCSGRVEVWHRGSWGSVCDDAWDLQAAGVVCRELGCGAALGALKEAAFGQGTGPVWLNDVRCSGTEASLADCPARPWSRSDCGHKEDAGVQCLPGPVWAQSPAAGHGPAVAAAVFGVLLLLAVLLALVLWMRKRRHARLTEVFSQAQNLIHRIQYKEMNSSPKQDDTGASETILRYTEKELENL